MAEKKYRNTCVSNIVKQDSLREVQQWTLNELKKALLKSAGPYGSTTQIIKADATSKTPFVTEYSKDGHTILKNIKFNKSIEDSIQRELVDVTRYIKQTVGDGSTSTIILASLIFDSLLQIDDKIPPYIIIEKFKAIVKKLQASIKAQAKDLTLEDVRKIATICTNNNKEVVDIISSIYEKHGLSVFIDVGLSTNDANIIKHHDGLTLDKGYASPVYINKMPEGDTVRFNGEVTDAGTAVIRNASVYAFVDPIDTLEMHQLFTAIVYNNIILPYKKMADNDAKYRARQEVTEEDIKAAQMIPTVVLCPKFSLDMGSTFTEIEDFMSQFNQNLGQKPPLLIVSNLGGVNFDLYSDLWRMAECPPIKKYIDPAIQQKEIEEGKAPTKDNVHTFCGKCDEVVATGFNTTFINPYGMFAVDEAGEFILDENGERTYSEGYQTQIKFLEQELEVAIANGEDLDVVGKLRRRIHSLKANMVEYFIGGITPTDRDATRVLVEDAVRNIRSASVNGYGYGTNYEGLRAIYNFVEDNKDKWDDEIDKAISVAIWNAYFAMSETLYSTVYYPGVEPNDLGEKINHLIFESIDKNNGPMNFVSREFDGSVLCTIDQDVAILEVLSKIITIMFTSNQTLTQTPQHNMYIDLSELD